MQMNAEKTYDGTADGSLEGQLAQAGAVVDKSIEHMLTKGLSPMAVASALLGGSLCLLARTMGDEAILQTLHNAALGVRSGELRNGSCGD